MNQTTATPRIRPVRWMLHGAGKRVACAILLFLAFSSLANARVGFFAPGGIPDATARQMPIVLFNAQSAAQVAMNMEKVQGTTAGVFIDLGHLIAQSKDVARIGMQYVDAKGVTRTKAFAPQTGNKLRAFPSDGRIGELLDPVFAVLARHAANVYAVLPVDEPYLNGVSKAELERVGGVVRKLLDKHGLVKVKLGVVFASGMFDRRFAHLLDQRAAVYASGIDDHFAKGEAAGNKDPAFAAWVNDMKRGRLTTYDQAGNMYVGGGLPRGYEVFGFDFYLSTLLLDGLHEDSLAWFAKQYPSPACAQFSGQTMSRLRPRLSFFHDGSVLQGSRYRADDRRLLDAMYQCRMGAMTAMLQQAARGRKAELLLIAESSNNGVLEFDAAARPESAQPELLVQARVLDEVARAEKFYEHNRCVYTAGLLYFTYADAYDSSIKLHVGGAADMPGVMKSIEDFSDKMRSHPAQCNGVAAPSVAR